MHLKMFDDSWVLQTVVEDQEPREEEQEGPVLCENSVGANTLFLQHLVINGPGKQAEVV